MLYTVDFYWVVVGSVVHVGSTLSLQASSPGRFDGGAGKGRRACNYVPGI